MSPRSDNVHRRCANRQRKRIRTITASVVTTNLQIHWLQAAQWFSETLLDAERFDKTRPDPVLVPGESRKRALQVYS